MPPLPVTELAGAQVLSLPLAAAHSDADIDDAVAAAAQGARRLLAVKMTAAPGSRWRRWSRRWCSGCSCGGRGCTRWRTTLRGTDLAWFLPAVAVSLATVPVMALRWQLLLAAKHVSVPLGWLTRTYFVALFAGQFLPAAIGGDAVRAVELGRRTDDAPEAVASVLIDRLVGVVSLVVLALVAVARERPAGGGRA